MNKKITSTVLAAIIIAGSTSFSAFAAMKSGSVVIGNKAFDLEYANNKANFTEISNAVALSGAVYVKDFNGSWIDNASGLSVAASVIPAVVYKNATEEIAYDAADTNVEDSNGGGGGGGGSTTADHTAPVISAVSLTIGGSALAAVADGDNYVVSLAGKGDTEMFTAINVTANEKATVKISFMGQTGSDTTNASFKAALLVSKLLGAWDPGQDGVAVKTLKGQLSGGVAELDATITDAAGNVKAITITITEK